MCAHCSSRVGGRPGVRAIGGGRSLAALGHDNRVGRESGLRINGRGWADAPFRLGLGFVVECVLPNTKTGPALLLMPHLRAIITVSTNMAFFSRLLAENYHQAFHLNGSPSIIHTTASSGACLTFGTWVESDRSVAKGHAHINRLEIVVSYLYCISHKELPAIMKL